VEDLVQWLTAQLDEDERTARAATLGPWVQSGIGDYGWTVDFGRPGAGVETADTEQGLADANFIATHNPARALREIEAKRRILECHESWAAGNGAIICGRCGREHVDGRPGGHFPCQTLRLLALPYADRPGFREEWRP
jgi:hypothetical protein